MQVPREIGDSRKRFVVGERLGEGGMGVVYAGRAADGEQAAIKFLHPHLAEIPEVVERFLREANAAGRITSPFVAPVLLAGRSRGGLYWIAYRRLFGETLEERLRRTRVLAPSLVRPFVEHVLVGLEEAHAAGVVHRDVKPANVFLERLESFERAVLLDFGVSKYTPAAGEEIGQPLTSTTQMLGTASYMAPEQVEGARHVDGRADLYAAGVIAFEASTGRLPFLEDSPLAKLQAKVQGAACSLAAVTGKRWPAACESFFEQALAKERDARFPTAAAMRSAWLQAVSIEGWPEVEVLRATLADAAHDGRALRRTHADHE